MQKAYKSVSFTVYCTHRRAVVIRAAVPLAVALKNNYLVRKEPKVKIGKYL
jgi:hypothetical protein